MTQSLFYIKPANRERKKWDLPKTSGNFFCVLARDLWNDYGFQTQYFLTVYEREAETGKLTENDIGSVKILKKGQRDEDGLQLTEPFTALTDDFCSLGQTLEYYQNLAKLGKRRCQSILKSLRDLTHKSVVQESFKGEPGWHISLLRDFESNFKQHILLAQGTINGDFSSLAADDVDFSFKPHGWKDRLHFSFQAPKVDKDNIWDSDSLLPDRLSVIIGRNGAGKSTVLARLARVAFGNATARRKVPLKNLGTIHPSGIGFSRIIAISFSAFDGFALPSVSGVDDEQVIGDFEDNSGRFIYIGIRDILAEAKERVKTNKSTENHTQTKLKSLDQLADEFCAAVSNISQKKRRPLLKSASELLFKEASFSSGLPEVQSIDEVDRSVFLKASTGHKLAILIIVSLIANIEPSSMILFDEPETHMHPPMLAALIHTIRHILERRASFAIIATHSPVVLQETLAQHVYIIKRTSEVVRAVRPQGETFGENIGLLTSEVFGLTSEASDYHSILESLISEDLTAKEIEKLFLNGRMSQQARSYVLSKIYSKHKE